MILQFIRFIKQMIDWRRAKNCMAGKHSWGPPQTRTYICTIKCKHCPAEYNVPKGTRR